MAIPIMKFTIDSGDERPVYVQIVDEVRRMLVLGSLVPDDPLPSIRQLALELRINPNTVAQAYRELEQLGIVEVRRGQGTYITDAPVGARERRTIAREVAARAILDAHRHGLSVAELTRAIQSANERTTGRKTADR